VTNRGASKGAARYRLVLTDAGRLDLLGVESTQGTLTIEPSDTGTWETGSLQPGANATLTLLVRMRTSAAARIDAIRLGVRAGLPGQSAAAILDGVGRAPDGGRWVAAGNVDGLPGDEIVTGTGESETPQVSVFSSSGAPLVPPSDVFDRSFRGGVRVAACDIDADGRDEVIAAQGPGGARVRVLRVAAGGLASAVELRPFEAGFAGGVFVACADIDGDRFGDLIVGAGAGRAPEVRVYSFTSGAPVLVASFLAFAPSFTGGVRVAAAASTGTGDPRILTVSGPGRPLEIALWQLAQGHLHEVGRSASIWPDVTGGALVALGDADGSGRIDVLLAPDDGRPALARLYSLATRTLRAEAAAGAAGLQNGGRFALGRSPDGQFEIIIADGPGGMPRVQVFRWTGSGDPVKRTDFLALELPAARVR
jgi:hypothetical protein